MLEVARLDDVEQNQHAAGVLGAPRGIGDGTLAFGRLVDDLQELALADAVVMKYLEGKTVKKVVVAAGRLVSIVAG